MLRLAHEQTYRGTAALQRFAALRIVVCGVGAVGSHLVDNLVRLGLTQCRVIDHDTVAVHNAGTQLYGEAEAGGAKVDVLKHRLFRTCGTEIDAVRQELTARNARKLLQGADLVVDAFDNSGGRQLVQETCRMLALPCLHVGLNTDYAEILWDEGYRVPSDQGTDVCAYPLARHLVLLAAIVAGEVVLRFAVTGERANYSITLRDFAVRAIPAN